MRTFFIAASAFLIAALIAAFLLRRSGVTRLPDGSELLLLGVSVGTNQFSSERPWHRLARRILPPRYHSWIPQPVTGAHGSTNGITIWFQQKRQTNQEFVLSYPGRQEIVSDNGETNRTEGTFFSISPPTLPHGGVYIYNYPRRQSSFLFNIFNSNQQFVATYRIPNPCRGPFPKWQPDPLPITKTNGDLAVTFNGVYKQMERFPPGKTSCWYRANFALAWQGAPSKDWEFNQSWISDPTGNRIGGLYPGLSTKEPVWCLHACFERTREATYNEQERCLLATLPVLPSVSFTNFDVQTNFQGSSFWLWAWSSPAAVTLSNGIMAKAEPAQPATNSWTCYELSVSWPNNTNSSWIRCMNFTRPTLLMAHIPVSGRIERLYIRDDHGRLCDRTIKEQGFVLDRFTVSSAYTPWYNHGFIVQPIIPAGAKFVTVEAIIQTPCWIDFYFEPPRTEKWVGQ